MKAAPPTLLWLAFTAAALAADGTPPAPQPRPRLSSPAPAASSKEIDPPLPATHPIVVMGKYIVRDTPVVEGAPKPVEREQHKFSWLDGGPMWSGKAGSTPVDVGLWRPIDILPETAQFRPQQTRADFGILRIKF